MTPTVTVTLTPQELGLLKAGLASYRLALVEEYSNDPELKTSMRSVVADSHALTDRLTDAQMHLAQLTF